MEDDQRLNELLKRLPKSDKEIIQEAKTERLTELHKLISEELGKREICIEHSSFGDIYFKSCHNENCDFEKERYGNCRCEKTTKS